MNVDHGPAPNATATPLVPVLRTVLLADLVDSTALLDALGDVRGATLLQRLDLHMRDLLSTRGGLLIDKADGVLALFERPVQAVDFALRYQRLLHELGAEFGVPNMSARVGIHVGEVMTWANDPRAVQAGAKPIEVEGIAKPTAARLMALALPGQVLLSGMAQSLAHRASPELGERRDSLRWLVHGRYRFKGLPTPMLVHEVGEAGFSPMRAPPSRPKAWREVPLWRRPPVLILEGLAILGIIAGLLYGALKSEPAMAFYKRDWIVVADLNNLTAESELDDPLETALRVGLQQSPHVNLVSDLRVEQTLERMGRDNNSPVDRIVGAEIAAREGARAVLLPTLADVGGRLQISLEIVDPNTRNTVFTETAEAETASDLLPALDDVLLQVRSRLGESVASIDQRSEPLAEVTTNSIEALRAYSQGLQARAEYRLQDAFALQRQAIKIDPDFALAYAALASLYFTNNDNANALANIQEALARKDKLTLREQLYLDAVARVYSPLEEMQSRWKLLASMYPDEYRAYYNYSYFEYRRGFDYEEALAYLAPAMAQQNPSRVSAHFLNGVLLLDLERVDEALAAFRQAEALGLRGYKGTYAAAYASRRDYTNALRVIGEQQLSGVVSKDLEHQLTLAAFEADQGRIDDAVRRIGLARRETELPIEVDLRFEGAALSLRSYIPDASYALDLSKYLERLTREFNATESISRGDLAYMLLAGAGLSARRGEVESARAAIKLSESFVRTSGGPVLSSMLGVAQAEIELAERDPQAAIEVLELSIESKRASYFAHSVLLRALLAAKDLPAARRQADWLSNHRGRAYSEFGIDYMWQAANVVESNLALLAASDLAKAAGDAAEAERNLDAFRSAWPDAQESPIVRNRSTRLPR
jgi:putative peptide modification system cyclase